MFNIKIFYFCVGFRYLLFKEFAHLIQDAEFIGIKLFIIFPCYHFDIFRKNSR